jgi:hypothetical protein
VPRRRVLEVLSPGFGSLDIEIEFTAYTLSTIHAFMECRPNLDLLRSLLVWEYRVWFAPTFSGTQLGRISRPQGVLPCGGQASFRGRYECVKQNVRMCALLYRKTPNKRKRHVTDISVYLIVYFRNSWNFPLTVCWRSFGYDWTDFHEICIIFRKSVEKIQVSLKSYKNNGYFTWRRMYIHDTSLNSSQNEKYLQTKAVEFYVD